MKIFVGTSGYSFKDWRGLFYPDNIPAGAMLNYYAEYFSCVEINSTYYNILPPRVFQGMVEKTHDLFEFIVKVHADVTHARKEPDRSMNELLQSIQPLINSDKFQGFLAQFPYSFKNTFESRRYLVHISTLTGDWPLFVEFRHISWATPPLYDFLTQHKIGYVNVDEPSLPNLLPPQTITTTDIGYFRFHGRNSQTWWNPEKGDRYDFSYSKEQLMEWKDNIETILERVKKLYLFFNNCHHGQAVQNALTMQDLLGMS